MKTAKLKLMGDILRVELRSEDRNACARAEIEITKIMQGVSSMSFPDGCTLARRRCDEGTRDAITTMLSNLGWDVSDEIIDAMAMAYSRARGTTWPLRGELMNWLFARMHALLDGKAPESDADRAALQVLAGRADCGCVYHAEEGIPCEHDLALALGRDKL